MDGTNENGATLLGRRAASFVDIEKGLVGREIFVDEDIYNLELERVFARCWLYLAHESQIPNPRDYVGVYMGEEPVLVTRSRDGKIRAFINSCRHRGNRVCRADQGSAKTFTCPYHGWTYDIEGNLVGVPGQQDFYHDEIDRSQWGLPKVAQVDSYRGLIFGTFDPEAPPLEEFLGDMRWGLDLLLDQGDMVAVPGVARWVMDVNWKFAADNAIGDMYHGATAHRSARLAGHKSGVGNSIEKPGQTTNASRLRNGITVVTEYGHGFNASYADESTLDFNSPLASWRKNPDIQRRLGPVRSKIGRANMNVFPNLFVNSGSRELMLRNPLGPTRMEIWKTVLVDRNSPPEVQRMQVRASNRHFGPAGMFEQEDGENWDQSTYGCRSPVARRYDLHYAMGLGHGEVVGGQDGGPLRVETLVNEHAQLWLYRCWGEFMAADSWPTLRRHHSRPDEQL